ncbi:MAG: chromosomal replication initiator protein DnaA [Chloroflexi bacterium]|nr:chromosomal replication initiator protein DnaA [Chloroflexota bacterium]MQC26345.1 chromosomal replication initiator protein DnaA [Chloroflexota bacterium]
MMANKAWQAALGQLQIETPRSSFDAWVKDAEFVAYEDGSFVIGVNNAYARDWLDDRLKSKVTRLLTSMMKRTVEVQFIVWQEEAPKEALLTKSEEVSEETTPPIAENRTLNPNYSFDNFVVGTSNRLAQAACLAVAERPGEAYNPLFLYGRVGLGKTHLMQAIGNRAHQDGYRVLFVSSEEFTNDLVQAIRGQGTQPFRDKYRQVDVLLIDDIQFILGKEATQEEFFHTFNTLHRQGKQIVMSCDRAPKSLSSLEDRLRSRFSWGLTADLQAPDRAMRLAILRSKAAGLGRKVSDEVLDAVAERMQSNVRELEGALTRTLAYADLRGNPLDANLVEEALADLIPDPRDLEPDKILKTVAESFGISLERMLARDRSRQVALPRQVAMYLLREDGRFSLPQIGRMLGGRDHTTVMYGCEKITGLMEDDERLRNQILDLREQLYGQPVPIYSR